MTNIALIAVTLFAAQAAVTVPETPPGRGLQGFVASFNAGGDARTAWLKDNTTMEAEALTSIAQQDAQVLEQHGPMTIVRLPQTAPNPIEITAIVRHAKSGIHGHLTIEVEPNAPHKVSNVGLRGATPEEVDGK